MLDLADDVAAPWFLELWKLVLTPEKARKVREGTVVARLLKAHRIRRFTAAQALERLRLTPVAVAPGTVSAATAHLEAVAKRLQLVNRQIADVDAQLDRLTEKLAEQADAPGQDREQRDVTILRSLPGVGRVVIATLLAEASEALQRRDYQALRCLSGVAPVTKRSGKSCVVLMRQAADVRLRNAVYQWARVAAQIDPIYKALRARGHGHARALRSVADRLLGVACAMLKSRSVFNPKLTAKTA